MAMIYKFTPKPKNIRWEGDKVEFKDGSRIAKYLNWYRMPTASKLSLKSEKNSIQACYSLFQTKLTCDSIPSKNGDCNSKINIINDTIHIGFCCKVLDSVISKNPIFIPNHN